jgi:hypothetical protein
MLSRVTRCPLVLLFGLAICLSPPASQVARAAAHSPPAYENFAEWRDACRSLPTYRSLAGRLPPKESLPLPSFGPLSGLLDEFFNLCRTGTLAQAKLWVGGMPAKEQFFNTDRIYFIEPAISFQPCAQKLLLPEGAEIIFHGDLHGDIHSLNGMLDWLNRSNYLSGFTVSRPNTHLIFLGDFTDRGVYSIEVVYTLLRLKLANPERVHLVRGNHEDVYLASRYGSLAEGQAKYGRAFDTRKLCRFYDFLPVAIYAGCGTNFIQCCHGGMEPGYSPAELIAAPGPARIQLLGQLRQRDFLLANSNRVELFDEPSCAAAKKYFQDFTPTSPTTPGLLGFMWNDFTQVPGQPQFELNPDRGYVYGDRATRLVLKQAGGKGFAVRAVFRGHQHSPQINPMMRRLLASQGIFRLWQENDSLALLDAPVAKLREVLEQNQERSVPDGSVWTFNVVPDSAYGIGCNFDFDTFGILKVGRDFKDWRLRVINLPSQR